MHDSLNQLIQKVTCSSGVVRSDYLTDSRSYFVAAVYTTDVHLASVTVSVTMATRGSMVRGEWGRGRTAEPFCEAM